MGLLDQILNRDSIDVPPDEKPTFVDDLITSGKRGFWTGEEMLGKATQAFAPIDSAAYKSAAGVRELAQNKILSPEYQLNTDRGLLGNFAVKIPETVGQMLPVIAASAIPGVGPVLGPAAALTMFGGSTYQDTKERILKQEGLDDRYASMYPDDPRVQRAKEAGLQTGAVQGIGDAALTWAGGRLLKGAFPKLGVQTADDVVRGATNPWMESAKQMGKQLGIASIVEPATEVAQDETQAAIERGYGLKDAPALWSQAADSAEGGLAATIGLAPLSLFGIHANTKRARAINAALANPNVDPIERHNAAITLAQEISDVNPEAANNFLRHAFDAIGDAEQTGTNPYGLNLNDPKLFEPLNAAPVVTDQGITTGTQPIDPDAATQVAKEAGAGPLEASLAAADLTPAPPIIQAPAPTVATDAVVEPAYTPELPADFQLAPPPAAVNPNFLPIDQSIVSSQQAPVVTTPAVTNPVVSSEVPAGLSQTPTAGMYNLPDTQFGQMEQGTSPTLSVPPSPTNRAQGIIDEVKGVMPNVQSQTEEVRGRGQAQIEGVIQPTAPGTPLQESAPSPATKVLAEYTSSEAGLTARVAQIESGFSVSHQDIESGSVLPEVKIFKTAKEADDFARSSIKYQVPALPVEGSGINAPSQDGQLDVPNGATTTQPWVEAEKNIQPYVESLKGMSAKQLKAEEKRTGAELNSFAANYHPIQRNGDSVTVKTGDVPYFETSGRFNAVNKELESRKSPLTAATDPQQSGVSVAPAVPVPQAEPLPRVFDIKASDADFGTIKKMVSDSKLGGEITFNVDNGAVITASRKGKYLHAKITHPSGKWTTHVENAKGMFRQTGASDYHITGQRDSSTPAPAAVEQPQGDSVSPKNHIAIYNGKEVVVDYVPNKKEEFKYAAMRVQDNLGTDPKHTSNVGYVKAPDGKIYEITKGKKTAKLVKEIPAEFLKTIAPPSPENVKPEVKPDTPALKYNEGYAETTLNIDDKNIDFYFEINQEDGRLEIPTPDKIAEKLEDNEIFDGDNVFGPSSKKVLDIETQLEEIASTHKYSDTESGLTQFSRTSTPVQNPHESAATLRKELSGSVNLRGLNDSVRIIHSKDAPQNIKPDAKAFVTKDGIIYFLYDKVEKGTAHRLALHEIGNHYGLEAMVGTDKWQQIMKQVENLRNSSEAVRKAFELVQKDTAADMVTEEALGYLAEIAPKHSVIRRIIAAVRAFLFKHFGMDAKHLTDDAMISLLQSSLNRVNREAGKVEGRTFQAVRTSREQAQHEKEYRAIEAKFWNPDGTEKTGAMLAPNGEKSNLNKHQWIQVRTESFKKWFGDWENDPKNASKVVDTNGEPLVVYKGMYPYDYTKETPTYKGTEISIINRGAEFPAFNHGEKGVKLAGFFGSKEFASDFAMRAGQGLAVYPAYLSFKNPYIINANGKLAGNIQFGASGKDFRDAIRSGKYDSVIIENTSDEGTIQIALSPTQIKSAIGNTGAFDGTNADIRYSAGNLDNNHQSGRVDEGGKNNENISRSTAGELFSQVKGKSAGIRAGLQALIRATEGKQEGRERQQATVTAIKTLADRYELGKTHQEFTDQYNEQTTLLGKEIKGAEHDVVLMPEDGIVVKRKDLAFDTIDYFKRLLLHNRFFPETAYALHGISENTQGFDAGMFALVTQKYFKPREDADGNAIPITLDELTAFMKTKGYELTGNPTEEEFQRTGAYFQNDNGDRVSDMAPRNAIIDEDGGVHVIDPQIYPANEESIKYSTASPNVAAAREYLAGINSDSILTGLKNLLPHNMVKSLADNFPRVSDALGVMLSTPEFEAERDAKNRKAGEVGKTDLRRVDKERQRNNMEILLSFMGYDGQNADKPGIVQRVVKDYTEWNSTDTSTEYGRIERDVRTKLDKQQQANLDLLQSEGDVNGVVYASLAEAMKNPRIAAAKPTLAAFQAYKRVRTFIDGPMAKAREEAIRKLGTITGTDKATIEKTIAAYREHLDKLKGWMPRKHGEGNFQSNIYHVIKNLPFTSKAVENGHAATLPFFAGNAVKRLINKFARENGLTVNRDANGAPIVTADDRTADKIRANIAKLKAKLEATQIEDNKADLQDKIDALQAKLDIVDRHSDVRIAEFVEASKGFIKEAAKHHEADLEKAARQPITDIESQIKEIEKELETAKTAAAKTNLQDKIDGLTAEIEAFDIPENPAARDYLDAYEKAGMHKGKLRQIKDGITKLGDGTIKVKVYMRLNDSIAKAQKHTDMVMGDQTKHLDHNYHAGETYQADTREIAPITEGTYSDVEGTVAMERLIDEAIKNSTNKGNITPAAAAQIRDSLFRATADTLLQRGAGRHQIKRAEYLIEGYDKENSTQIFKDYMSGAAGMLSKAMYAKQQFDNYRYAPADIKAWAETHIKNNLRNMGKADAIGGNVRAAVTFFFLGFKVSSVLVNGTQTWTLGVAELGRRTKQNSVKFIGKAQLDILKGRVGNEGTSPWAKEEKNIFNDVLWKEQEMSTAIHEMSGQGEGVTGKASKFLHTMVGKSLIPFQEMEMMNRRTMVLAAYRAFRTDGMGHQQALEQALDVNDKTNFPMDRGNLPQWAHHPVGRTAYALQSFVWNNWNWIYNRATSGEKADIIALLKYGAMITAIGGVSALSGGDEANKLIRRLTGKDYKLAMQIWSRRHAKEYGTAGEALNAMVWHGGMGALGVNISNAMRLNVPLSGIITGETTPAESVMGIWSGVWNKGVNTARYAGRGQFGRAIESAAPAFVEGPMKAYRMATQGATTSHGKPVFDENGKQLKYSGLDAAKRAIGLQPSEQFYRSEVTQAEVKVNAHWSKERGELLDTMRVAKTQDEVRAANIAIMKFNRDVRKSQAYPVVEIIDQATIRRSKAASKPDKKKQTQLRNAMQ